MSASNTQHTANSAYANLGITPETPELYDAIGILVRDDNPASISTDFIRGHFETRIKPRLSSDLHDAEKRLLSIAYTTLANPERKKIYDEHIYPTFGVENTHGATPPRNSSNSHYYTSAAREAEKLSIRNPAVAIGASALAAASAWVGLRAQERISEAQDKGETPSTSDKAIRTLALTGAAAIVTAAAIMWQAEHGKGR